MSIKLWHLNLFISGVLFALAIERIIEGNAFWTAFDLIAGFFNFFVYYINETGKHR